MKENISIERMLEIKRELNEKFGKDWIKLSPENGHYSVLWTIGEIGEMIDIIKKQGYKNIMENGEIRKEFIKELVDVMSYLTSVMVCYDISSEEFSKVYEEKHEYNMKRFANKDININFHKVKNI